MRKSIQVGDLLSWIAVEDCVVLVLSIGQVYDGGVLSKIYTVLTATGEIKKYPDYVIQSWEVISFAPA